LMVGSFVGVLLVDVRGFGVGFDVRGCLMVGIG
jgi:hypothetical protein